MIWTESRLIVARVEGGNQAIATLSPTEQVTSLVAGNAVAEGMTSLAHDDHRRIAVLFRQLTAPPLTRRQLVHHDGDSPAEGGFEVAEEAIQGWEQIAVEHGGVVRPPGHPRKGFV